MTTDLDLHVDETSSQETEHRDSVTGSEQPVPTEVEDEESNIFRVLGAQARSRSRAQLWVAALGGAVDAALLWWGHPMLGWLAAGCAAVAAYGIWGLLDRAMESMSAEPAPSRGNLPQLAGLRDFAAVAGTAAAIWAVLSFMAVALGNWNH